MAGDELRRGEKLMVLIGAIISLIILLGPLLFGIAWFNFPE
ncbi:MAG TPA: hypothetical protein VGW12_08620 [Pyrinomonadaceae bacterium]|nr:hypothetical protein [Pyrinomonadaceae bacterium]